MNQHRELARASLFYLASMLLVVSLGAFLQSRSFALGLIGTELFCILLPALIYLRWSRRSLSAALPLRWPGWKIALACLLLGATVFQIDALVEGIAVQISGYSQFLSPQAIPSTWPQALLTFVALVIAAPVCEEILFRGVILPAGLPYGKNFALAFSSILFIFFHLRLQGLPALVLVAFMLGWVALRTRSLTAAILVHMINNAFGAVLMILNGLYPQVKLPFPTLTTILISPLLLAGAVIALRRWTQSSEPSNAEMIAQPRGAAWLRTYWPLLIALLVYLTMAGYELVLGKAPQLLAAGKQYRPEGTLVTGEFRYQLRNRAEEVVGSAQCYARSGMAQDLSCAWQVQPYDAVIGSSRWISGAFERAFSSQWAAGEPQERRITWEYRTDQGAVTFMGQPENAALRGDLEQNGAVTTVADLDAGAPLEEELPWRLAGMPFEIGFARLVPVIVPDSDPRGTGNFRPALQDRLVFVEGGVMIETPAGKVLAWQVKIGDRQTAWYAVDAPHILLRYDDGMQFWALQ